MEYTRLCISVPQAGHMLGISRGLAYRMAREGAIPTLRFGKRMVVPKWVVERMISESVNFNPTPAGGNTAGGDGAGDDDGGVDISGAPLRKKSMQKIK